MNSINGYIYIRTHSTYNIYNACKLGKTKNIPERDTQYATSEIERGIFELVFEISIKQMDIVERLLQNKFSNLNIKYNAGTEFYNKEIINLIELYLIELDIKYKKLTKQEINNLIRCNRIRNIINKINIKSLIQILKTNNKYNWIERDYQTNIINYAYDQLLLENKIYIELPTGGGKSYIVYNLLEKLKSDFIIIISPRKIVNSQNISQKYLQILSDKYIIFNYSVDNNINNFLRLPKKKILICCTQSITKLSFNNINNITIWFDEAHWGVEEWDANNWLFNDISIKYRIFTSASPNKTKVLENENIFGKLYSPIKIKELITLNWLSPIKPYIYSENKTNINNIKYILNDFSEMNRKYGFSFHNKQKNAFNLFHKHYLEYKNNNTNIKPFLLISDDFSSNIDLDYDYKNIKTFENSIYSLGFVVAKYSMGYDFSKLDFICLSDPKLSIQDIKQSIGRGIRPDGLGYNYSNREKELVVSLPVYIDENESKYDKIVAVLKYLIYDIEIPFDEIKFKNRHINNLKNGESKINEYIGIEDIKSMFLDLLESENRKLTFEKAKRIISNENIKNKTSYYELCNRDIRLPKDPELFFRNQFTNWIDYLSIERIYYNMETCKNKINEYLLLYPDIKLSVDLANICIKLCEIDNLFPPNDLWVEYYNVRDLRDIIIITNNKKKKGVII